MVGWPVPGATTYTVALALAAPTACSICTNADGQYRRRLVGCGAGRDEYGLRGLARPAGADRDDKKADR